ncbi:hypothetical protein I3842_03G209100 [Carya illinoinensis]|uniref:CCHC-type domain-containing protein n=1 Tax=Carya illinoinensis TaxID=32201 RepID=A0A922FJ95_CARIL|nr:hypothetical protein I3842_03G209100 [Carya illinoinensis]
MPSTNSVLLTARSRSQATTMQPQNYGNDGHSRTICDHCGKTGHSKTSCYKLIGYPSHWNQTRSSQHSDLQKQPVAHQVSSSSIAPEPNSSIPGLTEQYHQLMGILTPPSANFAGSYF